MSEWIRIRVKDFYKDAVGELEYRQLPILHKSSTIQKKSRATPCGSLQGCMRMKESAEQT